MLLQESTEFPLEAQPVQAGSLAQKSEPKRSQSKVQKQVTGCYSPETPQRGREELGLVISGCFADPAGITQGTSMRISVAPSTCINYFFGLPTFIGLNI